MAITVRVSKDDFLASVICKKADWLPLEIEKVEVKPNNEGDSMNYIVDFRVLQNGKQEDMNEVPIRKFYSEKYLAPIIPLAAALGTPIGRDGGEFDLERASGKKVMGMVKPGKMGDRDINDIIDFRPIDG